MKISEVAKASGLSVHTIRYYEKSNLLPVIRRDSGGHRRFSPVDVEWLVLLGSLRATGMPIQTMKHFAELYRRGNDSIPERRAVLLDHARKLEARKAELDACAVLLTFKLGRYDSILGETS